MPTHVLELDLKVLQHILGLLGSQDAGRAACVHPQWRSLLADAQPYWAGCLQRELGVTSAQLPGGSPARSSRWVGAAAAA
jgi:hypothetical protein